MKICNIKGTPRMIQTIVLATYFTGLKRLIEQNAIGRPNGTAQIRVTANISNDTTKPLAKNSVISAKVILFLH